MEAGRLGIPAVTLTTNKLPRFILSNYSREDGSIYIDVQHIKNDPVDGVTRTVIHEVFHAYQNTLTKYLASLDSEFVENCAYFDEVRSWAENQDNYISGYSDFDSYREQPLEASANEYADSEWAAIEEFISD